MGSRVLRLKGNRKGEAWIGNAARPVLNREKSEIGEADAFVSGGRQQGAEHDKGQVHLPHPRSETWSSSKTSSAREPGEPQLALSPDEGDEQRGEAQEAQALVNGLGQSDGFIVPGKSPNEAKAEEEMEGRNPAKGKSSQGNPHRTSGRIIGGTTPLRRIRERAKEEVKIPEKEKRKFTNVLTHVRVDLLKEVFHRLKRKAAPGVDGRTWEDYAENLEGKLLDLQDRIHRMGYHPLPVKRKYIPKPDGRQRPLGIPAIEDKVVQGAITAVLTQIFEPEFRDTSYGFRPGRSQHDALQAVDRMMYRGKVNWVLDADICGYFDSIDHEWLIRMIGHRVTDSRMIRTIQRFLRAGVLEDEVLRETTEGTPQGGLISPLLANIYLHYALDRWFEVEKREMKGEAHLVRYADDFIIGFQDQQEARRFLEALKERLAKFGLQLHPEKTRLIRFGFFAERDCHLDGNDRPQTFDFLGFTHISEKSRSGKFKLVRRTSRKKRRAKLLALHSEMKERRHWKVTDQWKWLCSVLLGHYNYYAVTTNFPALQSFRYAVRRLWVKVLSRRSQRGRLSGKKLEAHDRRFPLPRPRILYGLQTSLVPC